MDKESNVVNIDMDTKIQISKKAMTEMVDGLYGYTNENNLVRKYNGDVTMVLHVLDSITPKK